MELTLSMLCQSKVAPNILAYAHVHGLHNNMCRPFVPMGYAIKAHIKEDKQYWDKHSNTGFNQGTSMEHHRYFQVYITKTRATRLSDMLHRDGKKLS
jgi:hypothetical protein